MDERRVEEDSEKEGKEEGRWKGERRQEERGGRRRRERREGQGGKERKRERGKAVKPQGYITDVYEASMKQTGLRHKRHREDGMGIYSLWGRLVDRQLW